MSFDAKVLRVIDDLVVLDRTSFYARGGGQEPDYGTISGSKVVDVNKHGGVILHKLDGDIPKEGETVSCMVDVTRRSNITKNHTSTHILNVSSRKILGSWVWQHSAFKDVDHARLDITHHSSLTKEQEKQIEDTANDMVKQNLPVTIEYFDRGTAEQKYGFRIYQGGVVPVKSVRIVSIEDFDVEACGGTHVKRTGDIQLIRIKRTKRIQDGVVRIEFVSGSTAQEYDDERKIQVKKQITMDDQIFFFQNIDLPFDKFLVSWNYSSELSSPVNRVTHLYHSRFYLFMKIVCNLYWFNKCLDDIFWNMIDVT